MKVYKSILETIGNTPLVELSSFKKEHNLLGNIFAKVEYFNPSGSVKDRIAYEMIKDALEKGIINQETVLIEPTSGNTGIGLAMVAASLGLKLILTMPETMSIERRRVLSAYGAEVVLTEGSKGMSGSITKANELHKEIKNSFIPSQFENEVNPKTHYKTTGPEIYRDLDGKIDVFVAGVGTGGTLSGTAKYLKEKNPNIKIVAVEPASSPVISSGHAGPHKIQGIGAGFIPNTLDTSIIDEVIRVSNEDSYKFAKDLVKVEGIFVGISAGAALCAATELALREEYKGKNIVVILPDNGFRYISVDGFID